MSNTEAWTSTFPSGMKFHDGERGSVAKLGGIPPIRFITVCENIEEAFFEKATVTIKFTDKAKDTYVKFTGGSPQQAVRRCGVITGPDGTVCYSSAHGAAQHSW